MNYM